MRCATKVLWLVMAVTITMPVGLVMAQISTGDPTGNSPQVPQPAQSGVNWTGVGIGAGTIAGNVLYVPAKLVYGILGGIGGGAGYVLTGGNKQVADTIWRSSLGGDYVLTPDMIAGKQPINFSGPTQTAVPPRATSYSSAPTSSSPSTTTSYSSYGAAAARPGAVAPIDSGAGPVKSSSAESYPTTSSYPVSSAKSSSYPSASYPTGSAASSSYPVSASRASTTTMSEAPRLPARKSSSTSSSSTAIE